MHHHAGTTSGCGYVCAKEVVRTGGRAICLNRPSPRAEASLASLRALCANGGSVVHIDCDVSSLASVAAAVQAVADACDGSLDVLVCNAGVGGFPEQRGEDGFELQMLCNHLSHWLLIRRLMPCLEAAAASSKACRSRPATLATPPPPP